MKIKRLIRPGILAAALALAGLALPAQAQLTNTYEQTFDSPTSIDGWFYFYSVIGNTTMTWDGTMDAAGSSSSGSLLVSIPFPAGGNQQLWVGSFDDEYTYDFSETANGLLFSNISFDVHVDPSTPTDPSGNFGPLNVGFYQTGTFATVTIPGSATNGWVHLTANVDYTVQNINSVGAFEFAIYSWGEYPEYPTNSIKFWMDNIALNVNAGPPPAPPTLKAPIPAVSGLNLIVTSPSGSGDRYQVMDTNDGAGGLSFVGHSSVTYSWTLKSYPTSDPAFSLQSHFFIVSGSDNTNTVTTYPGPYDEAADYNLANCIFIETQPDGTGGAIMSFRYKTNEIPYTGNSGNAMLFNTYSPTDTVNNPNGWPIQPIATIDSAQALGAWTLTFANNTNVTMTSPSGGTTNFSFDGASANLFADPCALLLGAQPNGTTFGGQDVVYSQFSLAGTPAAFSDNFSTDSALNTNYWAVLANDPNGVVQVPANGAYWVPWTLPAVGFSLYETATLPATPTQWKSAPAATIIQSGATKQALVLSSNLPGPITGYFSMISNSLSQLVVLFPGQTFTPGVAPGYSGTPTPIDAGGGYYPVDVTVIAVDDQFNPVSSTDNVAITGSNDSQALTTGSQALVNGMTTFEASGQNAFFFSGQPGSYTVTATDATTPGITGTSASVTVN